MSAGNSILVRSIRRTGRVNWRWWAERIVFVACVFLLPTALWCVLVAS